MVGGGVIPVKHESCNTQKQHSHRAFEHNCEILSRLQLVAVGLRLLHDLQ